VDLLRGTNRWEPAQAKIDINRGTGQFQSFIMVLCKHEARRELEKANHNDRHWVLDLEQSSEGFLLLIAVPGTTSIAL